MLRTLISGGINWNWYLQGRFDEEAKTVEILFYNRWHKFEDRGSAAPKSENTGVRIIEDNGIPFQGSRIATSIVASKWNGKEYESTEYRVLNPANVFSYNDFSHIEKDDASL